MKELVVISGKGGTGKTSIVASLASLAKNKVMVDCDVDASDLHLILSPEIVKEEDFQGGKIARLDKNVCTECGKCIELCRFDAISDDYDIDSISCEGCGVCAYFCPVEAIKMEDNIVGKWFLSETEKGPMVHAALGIAEDNSGKLVSRVREEAKKLATAKGCNLLIIDGSPGVGCPVIASVTGADLVLIVTEPTVSGEHDMRRVTELLKHFQIKGVVCINKYDLNMDMVKRIENFCSENGMPVIAKISYDRDFTNAQISGKSVVDYSDGPASKMIREMWEEILNEYL